MTSKHYRNGYHHDSALARPFSQATGGAGIILLVFLIEPNMRLREAVLDTKSLDLLGAFPFVYARGMARLVDEVDTMEKLRL
jgi:hypothetical protein